MPTPPQGKSRDAGRILNELRLALREERLLEILRLYKRYGILEQIIEGFVFMPDMEILLDKLKDIVSLHKIEFPQEAFDYGCVFLLFLL